MEISREYIKRLGRQKSTTVINGGGGGGGGGATGTVKSVAMTVPTGFSIDGSPITKEGTLALTFASGYSLPTTAKQSQWDAKQDAISDIATIRSNASHGETAYNWGNHANQGYATQTWVINNFLDISDVGTAAYKDVASSINSTNMGLPQANTVYNFVINQGYLTDADVDGQFWGQSWTNGGTVTGDIRVNGNIYMGSGAYSNQYRLEFRSGWYISVYTGMMSFCTNGTEKVAITSSGEIYTQYGMKSDGYVTSLSDIRKKNIISDINLSASKIAKTRAVRFTWKDRDDKTVFAGSIAQDWQQILPEAVREHEDGMLSLDYGVAALVSAITNSREITELRRQIFELKRTISHLQIR